MCKAIKVDCQITLSSNLNLNIYIYIYICIKYIKYLCHTHGHIMIVSMQGE